MRTIKNKKWIIPFAYCFLLLGCEDFLEVEPQNKYLDINFYTTESQALSALYAAYDPLQYTFVDGHWTSSVLLGEVWSDNANAGGGGEGDQPGWQYIDDLRNDPSTYESLSFWKKYYTGINKANQLLTNIKIESDVVAQYLAEAKFLRAFYHFELVRTFGPVPVVTTILDPNKMTSKRNTLTEVYTQIEKDLMEAIPLLPLRSEYPASMMGRITQGAAQALLGKVYIYWADMKNDDKLLFDKAADRLHDVIVSGEYQLLDDFDSLYAFRTANTIESVFEIQFTNLVPFDWNTPAAFNNGNMVTQLCGVRGLCPNNPDYVEGYGFMLPTTSLFTSFLPDDTYRRDAAILSTAAFVANGCPIKIPGQNTVDYTGFWQKKYANYRGYSTPNGGEINVMKDPNQPVIRYAEVLLLYAEALVRGNGSQSEALPYIDQVRERAKGPGDNTGNFKTAVTLMTEKGWSVLELIQYERRAELAGEGDRWFDLVRSGRAAAALFPDGDLRRTNFSEQDFYLPIPQHDVALTNNELTAYPEPDDFN